MGAALKLLGQKFGRWTILGRAGTKNGDVLWKVKCDCGSEKEVSASNLKGGFSKSCGCLWKPNLIGQHFGRLIVVSYGGLDKGGFRCWFCKCKCGKEHRVRGANLIGGSVRSCGCLRVDGAAKARNHLPILPFEKAALRSILSSYRASALDRKIVWLLEDQIFLNLIKQSCHYCGCEHSLLFKQQRGEFLYNGIDRLDPGGIYEDSNVASCCKRCNWMKGSLPYEVFVSQIQRISEHLNRANNR